jgi:hypothetical protein
MQTATHDTPFEGTASWAAGAERWSVPQAAMLVTALSVGLWLLVGTTASWLLT